MRRRETGDSSDRVLDSGPMMLRSSPPRRIDSPDAASRRHWGGPSRRHRNPSREQDLIIVGCEYAGKTTLANEIVKWTGRTM